MKNWFMSLEQREQWIVGGGGFLAAIIVLWGLVWAPLAKGHNDARADVAEWQQQLTRLERVVARIQAAPTSGPQPRNPGDSIVVIVDQTLRALELNSSVKRNQPTPNGIRIEFEAVAFDDLAVWLGEMSSTYAMEVQAGSLSIANTAGPGRINASLTLERAN